MRLALPQLLMIINGIYPLTAFGAKQPPPSRSRAISPEMTESVKSVTPEPTDVETRKIVNMMCDVKSKEESCDLLLTIVLRMDDKMNRQLTSYISPGDNPKVLAQELVHYGFINEIDRDKIANLIEESLQHTSTSDHSSPAHTFPTLTTIPILTTIPQSVSVITNSLQPIAGTTQVPMHSTS
ncbi:unnamed protein product [Diabrotica balteata]|uniref:Uncharacterized protein n=1 Tax=Diabrotica balteata TaxID=107213 RepID=A0A9N9XBV5_DIABA|nr:unnamed protein product [Diabrotica balteata]